MTTHNDLIEQYGNEIPYRELLLTKEWKAKRNKIIARDKKRCQECDEEGFDLYMGKMIYVKGKGYQHIFVPANVKEEIYEKPISNKHGVDGGTRMAMRLTEYEDTNPTYLHVHHKYYIIGHLPWEYEEEALITVCSECHQKIHESENISVYADENLNEELDLTPCFRCNGVGEFPEFKHVQNGICFRCGGAKYEGLIRDIDRVEDNFE